MGRKYTRITHLLRLVQIIQSKRGQTIADLAKTCERHERTIYRDIATLNESGIPCGFDPETNGYRVRPGFFMPPVELTFEEAMAMVALLEGIDEQTQIPFLEPAQRVAEKIRSLLPAAILEDIEAIDDHVQIDLARCSNDDSAKDVYRRVRDAIANKRLLQCVYESNQTDGPVESARFDLKPYCLYFGQRAWYCIGHRSDRDAVRMMKLERFSHVLPTDRPYGIPDDFDLRQFLGNAWRMIRGKERYAVAVHFQLPFAIAVSETRWHSTQKEECHEDGTVTLRFEIDGLDEIVYWILSYGAGAKVLEPAELAEKVKALSRRAFEQYE